MEPNTKVSKKVWIGRILSGLVALNLTVSAVMKFIQPPQMMEGLSVIQLPQSLVLPIGILELVCVIIYVVPTTAVTGAILLTGYMGGAIMVHLRVGEAPFVQVVIGLLVWLGLYLREDRLRALIPCRCKRC